MLGDDEEDHDDYESMIKFIVVMRWPYEKISQTNNDDLWDNGISDLQHQTLLF